MEAIQSYMYLSSIFQFQGNWNFDVTLHRQGESGSSAGLVSFAGWRSLCITGCRQTLRRPPAVSATGNHHLA